MNKPFLHDSEHFKSLIDITASAEDIKDPALVEKDSWIMHALWGLEQLKLNFHLKGGTSLSKGYACIHRFSEDLDLKIEPDEALCGFSVYAGKNHDDKKHRESRRRYFDWVASYLKGKIHGIVDVVRDENFDDQQKHRNGGVRLIYKSFFSEIPGLKDGILLEIGFDRTAPNQSRLISSWAFDRAHANLDLDLDLEFIDNRAKEVLCYEPKYTFVEKLQAVVRKFRLYKEGKQGANLPANFIRHYYDLYQLIDRSDVQDFIGTEEYRAYKVERFGGDDIQVSRSDALRLSAPEDLAVFEREYARSKSLYFRGRPTLTEILERIGKELPRL